MGIFYGGKKMTKECRLLCNKPVLKHLSLFFFFTWWSFFELLGYSAAHCPAEGNPAGTEQGNEMLFSQGPLGKKYSK